jgi:hypothetical protein
MPAKLCISPLRRPVCHSVIKQVLPEVDFKKVRIHFSVLINNKGWMVA